jgi:murein DD-endopeptidase MepM/ murein hydrolase activator NlpD
MRITARLGVATMAAFLAFTAPAVAGAVPEPLREAAETSGAEAMRAETELADTLLQEALVKARLEFALDRLAEIQARIPSSPLEVFVSVISSDEASPAGAPDSVEDIARLRETRDALALEVAELTDELAVLEAEASLGESRTAILDERAAAYHAEIDAVKQREAEEAARKAAEERAKQIAEVGVFPVAGPNSYIDSWGFARSGGRSHQGADIMAASGAPVVAIKDGTARASSNRLGGTCIYLTADDGTRYYYAHLSGYQKLGRVEAGDAIGYVGSSGNAGSPQLHIEIQPGGGSSVNPYPALRSMVTP